MLALRRMPWLVVAVALAGAIGCANGEVMDGEDAGADDMGGDGGGGPRRDGGGDVTCGAGQHRCGNGCIRDLANDPATGCRLGCGEPCPNPPDGTAVCSEAGTCMLACEPPFVLRGTECVCARRTCADVGFMCGAPDDGCGTPLDCGACDGGRVCMTGQCGCPPDEREPNDTRLEAGNQPVLAAIPDDNTWEETYAFNIDEEDDVDWLRFQVTDTGLDNPTLEVTLDGIPSGSNYDLAAFYVCSGGSDASDCEEGSTDNEIGRGCASRLSGTTEELVAIDVDCSHASANDSGTLYVRITPHTWAGSCASYRLKVHSAS